MTDEADVGIALFSSLNKTGVGDVADTLHGWVAPAELAQAIAAAHAAQAEADQDD